MFRKIRIGPRAAILFGILGAITLLVGVFSISQLSKLHSSTTELGQERMPRITLTGSMRVDFLTVRVVGLSLLLQETHEQQQQVIKQVQNYNEAFAKKVDQLQEITRDAGAMGLLDKIEQTKAAYDEGLKLFIVAALSKDVAEVNRIRRDILDVTGTQLIKNLAAFVDYQNQSAARTIEESDQVNSSAIMSITVAIVLSIAAIIAFALLFSRSIIVPLHYAVNRAQLIAQGDLSQPIHDTGSDEPAELVAALAQMQKQLHSTIENITDSSQQLATTSEELSQVTNDSSKIVQEQSDQLEQAATAVTELTAAVDEVASNANSTSANSEQANAKAQTGQAQLDQTVQIINDLADEITITSQGITTLADNVKDIGQVIDVIRAIAEQTNLLALNAAIEAARAGEQGRGFAVVADEVRALAGRTQESTIEIERMIGSVQVETEKAVNNMDASNKRVDSTRVTVEELKVALSEIVNYIGRINEQNLNIASAAEEQAMVAREVDQNLVSIRDLSFQTSAGANQTNASSQELARLAENLNHLVVQFKL